MKDKTGQRLGIVTVIKPVGAAPNGRTLWLIRCDCGNEVVVVSCELRPKRKYCSNKCRLKPPPYFKHGLKLSGTYNTWSMMKQRCSNPKAPDYPRYGGAGIKVCERWLVFGNFLADMGERPSETTLDRKDGKGNYEPDNCRWATLAQQATNRKNNTRYEFEGESLTIPEWARRYGIKEITLRTRIQRHGWAIERALTEPIKSGGPRSCQPTI